MVWLKATLSSFYYRRRWLLMLNEAALELLRLFDVKRTRAAKLGVLDEDRAGVQEFILSGDEGAIRSFEVGGNVRFFWDTAGASTRIVDIVRDELNIGSDDLRTFTNQMNEMEVTPPIEVPYGIIQAGTVVGINFTTDVGSTIARRASLGINQDTFVVRGREISGWLAKPTPSISRWLTRFWEEYSHGRVVDLSSRLRDFPHGIWSYNQGRRTWLEFNNVDNKRPAFVRREEYLSWDTVKGCVSQLVRRGGQQATLLNDWFTYR
jgi:hypothetical protein